jgi:biotin carboxyl carrier protein
VTISNTETPSASSSHVFISFDRADIEYVRQLVRYLDEQGVASWHDELVRYGTNWVAELQVRIDTCSAFVVIMSESSAKNEWVTREVQRALATLRPVMPVLISGKPFFLLGHLQYLDLPAPALPPIEWVDSIRQVRTGSPSYRPEMMSHAGARFPLYATLTCTIMKINCRPGQVVGPEEPLLVVEAMKMEHRIVHSIGLGEPVRVHDVPVRRYETVAAGSILVVVESVLPNTEGVRRRSRAIYDGIWKTIMRRR